MNIEQKIQSEVAQTIGQQVIQITTMAVQLEQANERISALTTEKDRLAAELAKRRVKATNAGA